MSETDPAAPATSSAAAPGEPSTSEDPSEARKPHSHWGGISTWNTVLATVLAIAGTVIAYEQWHLADVTNRASDQQAAATAKAADQESLVSLVGDIAALSESLAQTPGDEVAAVHQEMAVDAEQGLALVNELGGHVPAIDNLELGVGFEPSGELRWALQSFTRAGTDTTDPVYRSKALRAAAAVLYSLGGQANAHAAHQDTLLAYHTFDQQRDVPRSQFDQNHELVDLWDAIWSAGSDCPKPAQWAASDLQQATLLIKQDPESEDLAVREDLQHASDEIGSCRNYPLHLPYVPVS